MGWSLGYDENWKRHIGYGVPAECDHPACKERIDRGLAYVCKGEEPYGGEGCGLYFCGAHLSIDGCDRCRAGKEPFEAKPDVPEWIKHVLTDESWAEWRRLNPDQVARMKPTTANDGKAKNG